MKHFCELRTVVSECLGVRVLNIIVFWYRTKEFYWHEEKSSMEVNFDWETSKENVLPIKKGRALTDLAAQKSHSKEAVFEKTIEENNDNGDILLGTYAQYFTYVRRRAGDSRSASKVLLEVSTFFKFMSFIHLYFLKLSP